MNVFTDPLLAVRLRSQLGSREISLPQALEAAECDELADLCRLRPYQRPSVVTVFAILLHLGRRYGGGSPLTADKLRSLLDAEGLVPAGRLVAPRSEPAFLQPVLHPGPPPHDWNLKALGDIDGVFMSLGHETKVRGSAGATDQWLYALICGNHRIQVAHNPAGVRWGLPCVLPSDGITVGSEIRLLADAYDAAHADAPKHSMADHFAWLEEWAIGGPALPSAKAPQPFLEAPRPLRLVEIEGELAAVQVATHRKRFNTDDTLGLVGDPHVATVVGKGPYRWTKRRIGYRVWHAMLFGTPEASPPVEPAMTSRVMPAGTTHVRICGIAYDQGASNGYHERVLRVPEPRRRFIKERRVTEGGLSTMALEAIAKASYRALRPAFNWLGDEPLRNQTIEQFEEAAGLQTVTWVWQAFAGEIPAEDATLAQLVVREARSAFEAAVDRAAASGFSPLSVANAQLLLESRLRLDFPAATPEDRSMPSTDIPLLCRQTAAVLHALAQEIGGPDSEIAKRLRSMDQTTPGLAFWLILAAPEVPTSWCEDEKLQRATLVLVGGMARVRHLAGRDGQRVDSFGRALAKAGYTELRASSLLSARGAALAEAISHARQMLESRGVDALDWRLAAQLLVADAMDDAEALGWARRRLALDYARQMRTEAARSAA